MLQTAFCLPDCGEARTLTGHHPCAAGAAGCQEQRGCSRAGHLCAVASNKPLPHFPWLRLQKVTAGRRARKCSLSILVTGAIPSTSFPLWNGTHLALPQVGKSWIGPLLACLGKDRTFHASAMFLYSCGLCVCLSGDGQFFLPQSEYVHTVHTCACSCTLMFTPRAFSEQVSLSSIEMRHFRLLPV